MISCLRLTCVTTRCQRMWHWIVPTGALSTVRAFSISLRYCGYEWTGVQFNHSSLRSTVVLGNRLPTDALSALKGRSLFADGFGRICQTLLLFRRLILVSIILPSVSSSPPARARWLEAAPGLSSSPRQQGFRSLHLRTTALPCPGNHPANNPTTAAAAPSSARAGSSPTSSSFKPAQASTARALHSPLHRASCP